MRYTEKFGRIDSYKACIRQASKLPSWLSEVTDHLGKDHSPQAWAFAHIMRWAREDKSLDINHFKTLIDWVRKEYPKVYYD